jgi:hypothetical protein
MKILAWVKPSKHVDTYPISRKNGIKTIQLTTGKLYRLYLFMGHHVAYNPYVTRYEVKTEWYTRDSKEHRQWNYICSSVQWGSHFHFPF